MEGDGPPPPGLGSEFWYPLYEAMVELDVPALVHSASCCHERESYTLHFINEETTAVWELAESRVFEDFPSLKIVVSHGGGAIPYQMGRFRAWRFRTSGCEDWDVSVSRLYYDTCNYSKEALELLFNVMGPERCLFGTELPGTGSVVDPATGRALDDLKPVIEAIDSLSEDDRRRIFDENARKLYRLGPMLGKGIGSS
jgi:4-oxalmesaconate hydratase